MITIIFGAPGAGKSSLNTYFLKRTYETRGRELLNYTRKRIEEVNEKSGRDYAIPAAPPIYADYDVKLHIGYKKYYEPYFINGYYFGLANEKMETQFVPPGSKIFLSEVQRYFNSRKNQTFPDWVSRAFEMHRHYGLDITMDLQRPALVDLNIRELCKHFIEVRGMEHKKDNIGSITKTTFHCREFENWLAVEQYQKGGEKTYKETKYVNEGDIFGCFNSYSCFDDFLPPAGKNFSFIPNARKAKEEKKGDAVYYRTAEPKEYRSK